MTGTPRQPASLLARIMLALALLAVLLAVVDQPARGQDRSGVIRVLRESRDFRARTRAALALGASADPAMGEALAMALRDPHPAVRAAAASGLGRLGTRVQVQSLRAVSSDAERSVRESALRAITAIETRHPATPTPAARPSAPSPIAPPIAVAPAIVEAPLPSINWARTQIVVVLGAMENRSGYAHPPLARVLRSEVLRALGGVRGVGILRDGPEEDADREIRRRRIRRYRLEGSIRHVTPDAPPRQVRVRCDVGLMLLDDPGLNLRAALDGSATGTEPARAQNRTQQEQQLAEQALQGAVRSAMNGAAQALQRSGGGR